MSVFTIYNCGTAYNASSGDVIARLHKNTSPVNQTIINAGPGSGSFTPNFLGGTGNPGGASTIGGLLFGSGVETNVKKTIEKLYLMRPQPTVVNLCGWSRGGITCAKIANELNRLGPPLSRMAINIFAIDPVPGSNTGGGSNWNNISISRNIRYYSAVLAQHDLRSWAMDSFQAVYPQLSEGTNVEVDVMPGSHSSIVEFKGAAGKNATAELVYDMAQRFLRSHGTQFSGPGLLSNNEILKRYALIQENFDFYSKLKTKHLKKLAQNPNTFKREIMDASKQVVGSLSMAKPAFFINEHHRETFRFTYPYLGTELDRDKLQNPFANPAAANEFDRLGSACPEQGKTVLLYFLQALK